jgi:hypothetical protein
MAPRDDCREIELVERKALPLDTPLMGVDGGGWDRGEMPRGPVVEALLECGFRVYAISPKQPNRFRDRCTVAGAKRLPQRRLGTTAATRGYWATACAPTGMPFGPYR